MILTITLHPAVDLIYEVPRLERFESVRAQRVRMYTGGKGNNTARALHRLGEKVMAAGFQGGHIGRLAARFMKQEGIPTTYVFCRAETRCSVLVAERETRTTFGFVGPRQDVTADEVAAFREALFPLFAQSEIVAFCGSAPTPLTAQLIADGVKHARAQGCWVVVDSSGLGLQYGVSAGPHFVKVNRQELAEWIGRPVTCWEDVMHGIRLLHRSGVPWVGITLGAEGMVLSDGEGFWHGTLPVEQVLTTQGCGDALLAGILHARRQGLAPEDWVRWGVACGAANTQVLGSGFISRDEVQRLVPQVTVRTERLQAS